jgi:hypothetical protein
LNESAISNILRLDVGGKMIDASVEAHYHNEFKFAKNTDSKGCCCFWKSRTVRPKEYYVDKAGELTPFKSRFKQHEDRIQANRRFAEIGRDKFVSDPINENIAFEMLAHRVNHDFSKNDKITEEKLMAIVNEIHKIREEIRKGLL